MTLEREAAWADLQVLSIDEDNRTVEYVMSDDSVDSYGEIVEQIWRLERYKRNPVVLYAHNHQSGTGFLGGSGLSQEETLPIGRVIKGPSIKGNKETGKRLVGTVEFAPEEVNPFAERVWQLVKSGFLRAGSVGFYPHDVRREVREDAETYILSDNELFEFSACPIGANANAIANSLGSREERRALLAKLAAPRLASPQPQPPQPAATGQERSTMDETEMKARLAELEKTLETERSNARSAQDRAQAAEARAAELLAERDAVRGELATVRQAVETVTKERDEALKSAQAFESSLIDLEIDALVGKKFHAAERAFMREDRRRLGKKEFAERMAARTDLTTSKLKLPEDTAAPDFSRSTEAGQKTSTYVRNRAS